MNKVGYFFKAATEFSKAGLIIILLAPIAFCALSGDKNKPAIKLDFPSAAPYTIEKMTSDFSIPGRSRQTWLVRSLGVTNRQTEDTAKKAAVEIQTRTKAAVVQVFLVDSSSDADGVASVFYAPDGKGNSGEQGWVWDGGVM